MIKTLVHTIQKNMKLNKRYGLGGLNGGLRRMHCLLFCLFLINVIIIIFSI